MIEVKMSSKNQIVIPRLAREALKLKAGDRLMIVVRGARVLVLQHPESHRKALRGLGKGLFPAGYSSKEHRSWR